MSLNAWRVNFSGQHLLVAEQSLVEYISSAVLHAVPGYQSLWAAVTFYDGQWLPVLTWQPLQETEAKALLILQVENNKIAVIVSEAPIRYSFSNANFVSDSSKIPQQWLGSAISCVEVNNEILPIIAPDKLEGFRDVKMPA